MAYIKKSKLGGAVLWAVDLDDFQGFYGPKWPLLSTVKKSLLGKLLLYETASLQPHHPEVGLDTELVSRFNLTSLVLP